MSRCQFWCQFLRSRPFLGYLLLYAINMLSLEENSSLIQAQRSIKLSSFPRLTAYLLLPKWGRISFQYGTGLEAVCWWLFYRIGFSVTLYMDWKFKLSVQVFVLHVQDWGAYMLLQHVKMPVFMPVFEESTFFLGYLLLCAINMLSLEENSGLYVVQRSIN